MNYSLIYGLCIDDIRGMNFIITRTKLYISRVTLFINNSKKFLKNLRKGIKTTISWNKWRYDITTIRNIDKLIVLSFKNDDKESTRTEATIKLFTNYYIPLVDIKHFNALFDNKPFFDQPIK